MRVALTRHHDKSDIAVRAAISPAGRHIVRILERRDAS
jgi:hypothetical protein